MRGDGGVMMSRNGTSEVTRADFRTWSMHARMSTLAGGAASAAVPSIAISDNRDTRPIFVRGPRHSEESI